MTRHIIATALATALAYLIGAFIAWDWWWMAEVTMNDRFAMVIFWAILCLWGSQIASVYD